MPDIDFPENIKTLDEAYNLGYKDGHKDGHSLSIEVGDKLIRTKDELMLVILAMSDFKFRRKLTLTPDAYEIVKELDERFTTEFVRVIERIQEHGTD